MTKAEFIELVVANHKSGKWINGTFEVDGVKVGIKAYGRWVQRLEASGKPYWSNTECRTLRDFRASVETGVNYLFA